MFRKWQTLRKRSKGFTLIELMIVVAIIAILAAIAIPQYKKFQQKARAAEAKTNLGAIATCEETYKAENDKYLACAKTPSNTPTSKTTFGTPSAGFDTIGFEPTGAIRYAYKVIAGGGGDWNTEFSAHANSACPDVGTFNHFHMNEDRVLH